ncbi:MAG: CAP domain-containing protein [Filimonas sp.]|nr:CAP domain-containing protein [Filimonas sp.]
MMKTMLAFLFVCACAFKTDSNTIDKNEAKAAFLLINQIRSNPAAYSKTIGIDLSYIKALPALRWNDTLARAAEAKALDMANRNYFGHVNPDGFGMNYFINKAGYTLLPDWLDDNKKNFFESIQAGSPTGEEAVKYLILDANTPSLGHRKHLLGIGDWNAGLVDIGIGFVKVADGQAKYKTYTSILIAKHTW